MRKFFAERVEKALKDAGLTKEDLAYKVLPSFLMDLMTRYLRVEVEGAEHIPRKGPCIIISNHSGYMGFDALMLGHHIYQKTKRVPRIIAHKLWFFRPEIAVRAKKLGFVPATYDNGLKMLEKNQALILFPEGEEGNFKPTSERYRLRRFRRGFVRLALATGAPIVPAVVVGAEETHITLSQVRWAKHVLGIIVPIPLNVLPLPARWRIRFYEPIQIDKSPKKVSDVEYVTKLSQKYRTDLQKKLHAELKDRKFVFL